MEYVIICIVAFAASVLTFFSGFGLGTILMPVFALFFPLDIAIALTGVVHFASNLFKGTLVWKQTDWKVIVSFGIPAVIASFFGAWLMLKLSGLPSVFQYSIGNHEFFVTPIKLTIAILLLFFCITEIVPVFEKMRFKRNNLVLGGVLSGFFGGLSGIQGALRSAFLIRQNLSKEAYIATGVIIACFIDITRLSVYAERFTAANLSDNVVLLIFAILAAIAGVFIGNKLLKKVTLKFVQTLVSVMLIGIAVALGFGLI